MAAASSELLQLDGQVSDFGLVIITRKRVKQSLERVLTEPCPYCSGTGVIKSSSTICYEILSEVKKVGPDLNGHRLLLRVNPDIARALKEEESAVLKDLQQSIGKDVTIKADVQLHHEQFDVMALDRAGRGFRGGGSLDPPDPCTSSRSRAVFVHAHPTPSCCERRSASPIRRGRSTTTTGWRRCRTSIPTSTSKARRRRSPCATCARGLPLPTRC